MKECMIITMLVIGLINAAIGYLLAGNTGACIGFIVGALGTMIMEDE